MKYLNSKKEFYIQKTIIYLKELKKHYIFAPALGDSIKSRLVIKVNRDNYSFTRVALPRFRECWY